MLDITDRSVLGSFRITAPLVKRHIGGTILVSMTHDGKNLFSLDPFGSAPTNSRQSSALSAQ
jgi:hypothetical protein